MAKQRIKREIFVSEVADEFLKKIREDGGDDMAFAGILFEMAIQMVRTGHIRWNAHGFECTTDKGVVTINIAQGNAPPADKPATPVATNKSPSPLADIAKSMKAGASKPAAPADKKKLDD
ncbi:MAG: hypothetical protein OEW58_09270 [Gammaproteobacteria bacterium]|nr:hypothetical protein [Gammaproteobacteria bacterium]